MEDETQDPRFAFEERDGHRIKYTSRARRASMWASQRSDAQERQSCVRGSCMRYEAQGQRQATVCCGYIWIRGCCCNRHSAG